MTGLEKAAALMSGGRLGLGLTAAPSVVAGGWLGADASRPATQVAIRALGARDAALGAGGLLAAARGQGVRSWMAAAAVSDLADALASLGAGRALPGPGRVGTVLLASGAAIACAAIAAGSSG